MKHKHCRTQNMMRNFEKRWKMRNEHVGPGKCRDTLKNVKNEKCTLQDLEYGKNTAKC